MKTIVLNGREFPLISQEEAKAGGFQLVTEPMSTGVDELTLAGVMRDLAHADCTSALVEWPNPFRGCAVVWAAVARTRWQSTAQTAARQERLTVRRLRNLWLNPEPSAM